MRFDKDLVRDILLAVEASSHDPCRPFVLELPDREQPEISYHVMLLHEAGFMHGQNLSASEGILWHPIRLTYQGHEFLDTVRDGEVWRRTKAGAEKAGMAGLSMLLELGKAVSRQVLKERLGIDLP